jgi:hypothetical protein
MNSFKNNRKKSTLSFKVIVVCLLLSGSLITPGFARANCYTTNIDGTVLINGDECTESALPPGGSLVIDNTVTSIGVNAFRNNTALISVTIPDSVLVIEDGAFWGANRITSLTIGNGVITIGARAFNGANKITSLIIPNSVTTIGTSAFSGTTLLTSLTLGNQLTTIGDAAFAASAITILVIPNSVTTIGTSAFSGTTLLTSLTLGNQLTTIGDLAFEFSVFSSVTLPASLTTLGSLVFMDNSSLVDVNFLGNAPVNVDELAFDEIGTGAKANVPYNATGFGANGSTWNRLIVSYGSAPSSDSGSTTASVTIPIVIKTADVVFNLKNKKYLSKYAMKTKLSKSKSFKRNPKDLYKYSIFKASKKNCLMRGNYVMALKKTGSCDLYATRTTPKGAKYKYWVKINYSN